MKHLQRPDMGKFVRPCSTQNPPNRELPLAVVHGHLRGGTAQLPDLWGYPRLLWQLFALMWMKGFVAVLKTRFAKGAVAGSRQRSLLPSAVSSGDFFVYVMIHDDVHPFSRHLSYASSMIHAFCTRDITSGDWKD